MPSSPTRRLKRRTPSDAPLTATAVPARRARAAHSTVASAGAESGRERRDTVSLAYETMRRSIVAGELPAGSRIVERTVAERLGISRTPVRSALHRLQQEGFIESSGRGADQRLTVTPLTEEDGRELFLLVGHLEGLAARLAAALPRPARLALVRQLKALNRTLANESRKRPGINRTYELDEQFHRAYVEAVAGRRVVALHRAVKPQTERYARFYVDTLLGELPISVREHDAIIAAIANGAASIAQRTVEANWHNAADRLGRTIAEHGEQTGWLLTRSKRPR